MRGWLRSGLAWQVTVRLRGLAGDGSPWQVIDRSFSWMKVPELGKICIVGVGLWAWSGGDCEADHEPGQGPDAEDRPRPGSELPPIKLNKLLHNECGAGHRYRRGANPQQASSSRLAQSPLAASLARHPLRAADKQHLLVLVRQSLLPQLATRPLPANPSPADPQLHPPAGHPQGPFAPGGAVGRARGACDCWQPWPLEVCHLPRDGRDVSGGQPLAQGGGGRG